MSSYEKLTYKEATEIIFFYFNKNLTGFREAMSDLIFCDSEPHTCIAPIWYSQFKAAKEENKENE